MASTTINEFRHVLNTATVALGSDALFKVQTLSDVPIKVFMPVSKDGNALGEAWDNGFCICDDRGSFLAPTALICKHVRKTTKYYRAINKVARVCGILPRGVRSNKTSYRDVLIDAFKVDMGDGQHMWVYIVPALAPPHPPMSLDDDLLSDDAVLLGDIITEDAGVDSESTASSQCSFQCTDDGDSMVSSRTSCTSGTSRTSQISLDERILMVENQIDELESMSMANKKEAYTRTRCFW